MRILGIETTCDETSVAIIDGEKDILTLRSNIIASSLAMHAETGGIIPEVAARQQLKYMIPVLNETLKKAEITEKDPLQTIDAIAVTYGPGLIGSLLVGVETAKTLAFALQKPIIPVNHMVGHIYANWIEHPKIQFPAVVLVVSGGHTDLLLLKKHGDLTLLGGTRDDAAGECFDKCARLLGFMYPGGPKISKLAEQGDKKRIPFPRPMIGSKDYDFSFSGLKTAFLNETKKHFPILRTSEEKIGWQQALINDNLAGKEKQLINDLCASLQQAIIDVLVRKTLKAVEECGAKSVVLSGGVAANQLLRDTFENELAKRKSDAKFYVPARNLCTDNAAMIAAAAYFNNRSVPINDVTANPELYFD